MHFQHPARHTQRTRSLRAWHRDARAALSPPKNSAAAGSHQIAHSKKKNARYRNKNKPAPTLFNLSCVCLCMCVCVILLVFLPPHIRLQLLFHTFFCSERAIDLGKPYHGTEGGACCTHLKPTKNDDSNRAVTVRRG